MSGPLATLGDLLERNATRYPSREALVADDLRLTYRDLFDRATAVAGALHRIGARQQDRIGILALNSPDFIDVFSACEWAGYIATPFNYRLTPSELAYLISDSRPRVLLFDMMHAPVVAQLRSQLPAEITLACLNGGPDFAPKLACEGAPLPPYRARPGDFVHLMYTSGTTGRPKGAVRTHRAGIETALAVGIDFGLAGDERALVNTPLFHVGAKDYQLATSWFGGSVILQSSFDPVMVLRTIAAERITSTFMVSAMLQAVLDAPGAESFDLTSVRTIMTAAAPIPLPLLERAIRRIGPVFTVLYGMTESGGNTVLPRHETVLDSPESIYRLTSVGHPGYNTEIRVVDDEGRDVPSGVAGEVLMRSPAQFSGYWNNTAATVETLRDGWLHTGDIGIRDEQDYLFIVDRKKDMIISGGENIYSREVEDVISRAPGVIEGVVIGVPDPKWGETVRAVVVVDGSANADGDALIAFCRQHLAKYKCPTSVVFVDALPRGATGKIDKAALRRAHLAAMNED